MSDPESQMTISVWPLEPGVRTPRDAGPPEVCIGGDVMARVKAHARLSPHCEIGGVLLGRVTLDGGSVRVEVAGHLPAEAVESGPAHVTFTHETWRLIRERRREEFPGASVVGWYHTHPGLGVFLSGQDRALHQSIFRARPWCVALVLDPLDDTRAFFWLGRQGVTRCAESSSNSNGPQRVHTDGGIGHGIPDPKD